MFQSRGNVRIVALVAILLIMALLGSAILTWQRRVDRPRARGTERGDLRLPPPNTAGGMPLAEALAARRSRREFAAQRLTLDQVAQLCWAGQGITDIATGHRTAPSAGALYPLTIFVVDSAGIYEYEPRKHVLQQYLTGDFHRELQAVALDQPCVGAAPVCLVIAMDVARSASKYGSRAERYCLLEAGHSAQNVLLQATAIGLAGVPVGAFDDGSVAELLHLPQALRPVYLLPIGFPTAQR